MTEATKTKIEELKLKMRALILKGNQTKSLLEILKINDEIQNLDAEIGKLLNKEQV